jgi:chromosomal replication initiator protein
MTEETWGQVRAALMKRVGRSSYQRWIEPLQFRDLRDGVVRFGVPTNFFRDWVTRNFSDQIRQQLIIAGVAVNRIEFTVEPVSGAANSATWPVAAMAAAGPPGEGAVPPPPLPARAGAPARAAAEPGEMQGLVQGAVLDPRCTFETFVVGKPNELAHAAARRVAEGGPITFNPLFLYGGVGLGKTHLMQAVANEIILRRPHVRVLYLSAEQFMYRFVQALRDKQIMSFKEIFRSVDVLMVDDVQFIAGKDSTQEEFFHTFNALVDQQKRIVLSADRSPGEIRGLEERIRSRLQSGLVVDLHPTDYELRLGILQTKIEYYRRQIADVRVAPGVLEFIAHRVTSNVRTLEGAIQRLIAFASLVHKEITLELTQDCLSDILRQAERKVTLDEILRKVAEHYNIRLADLAGPKRTRAIARPRQVAMYLAKQLTPRSLPEIGRRFGGRDHTTILHGVKKIEELMATDSQLAEDIHILRRALED